MDTVKMTPAAMVEMYIKLRDAKRAKDEEHKKSCEKITAGMEKLEGLLLAHLQETGAQSLAAAGIGTVYRSTRKSASVQDREAFLDWAADDHWDALDAKVNMSFVNECLEKGTAIPDFIKVSVMHTIGVQRK